MTPEDLLNLYAERAALSNLQDEDDNHFDELDEIDRQIRSAAPDIARALIEARLTLAAEQGRPEGAPSQGWNRTTTGWRKGRLRARRQGWGWGWVLLGAPGAVPLDAGVADTAREAMRAADRATS